MLIGREKQPDKEFEQWEMKKEERSQANFFSPESGPSVSTIQVMVLKDKPADLCKFYKTPDIQC